MSFSDELVGVKKILVTQALLLFEHGGLPDAKNSAFR